MPEGKTIGQLMEEMRQKAGAQNYHGHDYMDLQRFAENYEKALDSQAKGQIKILSHAKVRNGDLLYDRSEQIR